MATLNEFFADLGGIAGVRELADFLNVNERVVRDWAHENDVPRAGNAFAFRLEDAEELAADLEPDDEDEDDGSDDEDPDESEEDE